MVDILDKLQNVDGYVRLVLSTGEIVYGHPDCIVYEEDDEGWDTIKQLRFEPWCEQFARYFGLGEIESYEECDPPKEMKSASSIIVDKVIRGEKAICPKCGGEFHAHGKPETSRCFECDTCHIRIFIDDHSIDDLVYDT